MYLYLRNQLYIRYANEFNCLEINFKNLQNFYLGSCILCRKTLKFGSKQQTCILFCV